MRALPKMCVSVAYSQQGPGKDRGSRSLVGMYVTYTIQLSLVNESEN